MRKYRTREIYWAAGFLEGEGSFCANKGGVRITADQAREPAPIARLHRIFGGYRYSYNNTYGPVYRWALGAWGDVEGAIALLYPLMSPKRQRQIDRALAGRVIRNGHNNRDKVACPRGHPYDRVWAGKRACSICANERNRAYRARGKAKALADAA